MAQEVRRRGIKNTVKQFSLRIRTKIRTRLKQISKVNDGSFNYNCYIAY